MCFTHPKGERKEDKLYQREIFMSTLEVREISLTELIIVLKNII